MKVMRNQVVSALKNDVQQNIQFIDCKFIGCEFNQVTFIDCTFIGCEFNSCIIENLVFNYCTITKLSIYQEN